MVQGAKTRSTPRTAKTAAPDGSQDGRGPLEGRRRFRRPLEPLGTEVPTLLAPACQRYGFHAADLLLNWRAIAGEAMADYTQPRRIKWARRAELIAPAEDDQPAQHGRIERTVLQLWVDQGRAHEIPYLKAPLIERINQYFGYRAITDIEPMARLSKARTPVPVRQTTTPATPEAQPASNLKSAPPDRLAKALADLTTARAKRQAR
jgi:hypothetical protein